MALDSDFQKILVMHAAPCLVGLKFANLIQWPLGYDRLFQALRENRADLAALDLSYRIFPGRGGRILLYLYREADLAERLAQPELRRLLQRFGYAEDFSLAADMKLLTKRLAAAKSFPHEIGFFLDYPIDDVQDFIEGRRPCQLVGAWKVYNNVEAAKAQFERFARARADLSRRYEDGLLPCLAARECYADYAGYCCSHIKQVSTC